MQPILAPAPPQPVPQVHVAPLAPGVFAINGDAYRIAEIAIDDVGQRAFEVRKLNPDTLEMGEPYHVKCDTFGEQHGPQWPRDCDCKGGTYGGYVRKCKHANAVIELIRLGLLPIAFPEAHHAAFVREFVDYPLPYPHKLCNSLDEFNAGDTLPDREPTPDRIDNACQELLALECNDCHQNKTVVQRDDQGRPVLVHCNDCDTNTHVGYTDEF
jgi:hypothetical protein